MSVRSSLILSALLSSSAIAAPTIDPQFGDHAVLQRNAPIRVSGTAAAGEALNVSFGGATAAATADPSGHWSATFPPRADGAGLQLAVSGPGGSATSTDLVIGDVWLCSGQSNMEYPVPRALGYEISDSGDDPELRLMKVPHQLSEAAQASFSEAPQWKVSAPGAASDFSAACYFMVRQLREQEKVPIGAIDDSWGGTPIRAWVSLDAVAASGGAEDASLVSLHQKDPAAAVRRFGDLWGQWWRSKTGNRPGTEPWKASNSLDWKPVPSLTYWDSWGPEWKNWVGSAWMREKVTLTAAEAAEAATVSLSGADDMDQTFVNGIVVGGIRDPFTPRSYPVPKGVLKAGTNEIMVFVRNVWGQGGFTGPADKFALSFADGHSRPLTSGWEYSRVPGAVGDPPVTPWAGSAGASTIYNAMVAPLGQLGIKGVAWYQGENDVEIPGYAVRLAGLMADWRRQFANPQLPVLVVGLAGFGTPVAEAKESHWAGLVNSQRVAATADPNAALITAIDLGEWHDIHPANKQEVGRRLALGAEALAYGDPSGRLGPLPLGAVRSSGGIDVTFSKPLQVMSGNRPIGFQLCGDEDGSCRFADASVNGATVTIAADGRPATRVRYAWADYPIVNLYDLDLLPAPVFELPVQ